MDRVSRRVLFCSAQPACARIPLQRTDAPKALPVAVGVGLTPSGAGARAGDEGDWAGQPCSEPEVEGTLQSNSRTTLPNSTRGDRGNAGTPKDCKQTPSVPTPPVMRVCATQPPPPSRSP